MQARTRLGLYVQKIIEAGWLLALVSVPLYLNVYSNRVFEPDKLAILRTVAVLIGAGILTLWIDAWAIERPRATTLRGYLAQLWRFPLVRPTLLLWGAYLLATLFSVAPRISLWGSYQRLQGTFTFTCYLILFAAVLLFLRTKAQLDRLITTILFTSVPVALYGLLQSAGLDPLPWSGDVTKRIASTLGNAIFVGAYLIMVIPLTLERLVKALGALQEGQPRRTGLLLVGLSLCLLAAMVFAWLRMSFFLAVLISFIVIAILVLLALILEKPATQGILAGCYLSIMVAQGMALLYSGSRGPQVGLVGGLLVWALLVAATRKRRFALEAALASGMLVVAFLILFNLPQSPLASLRQVPYLGRLGQLLELEGGTGKVRTLIWQGAVEMLQGDLPRSLIGHGPETMYVAYNRYYPAELAHYEARNATPDRSHNETFDMLLTTGVVGLAASLAVFIGIFYHGYVWLGLIAERRAQRLFFLCTGLGGMMGIFLPRLLEGTWRLAGVGLPFGIITGLAIHVVAQAFWGRIETPRCEPWAVALIIALLAAITAHWIEISVGIAIASTRTYFWVYTALLLLLGQRLIARSEAATENPTTPRPHARKKQGKGRQQPQRTAPPKETTQNARIAAGGLLMAVILGTMVWNYVLASPRAHSAWDVLRTFIASTPLERGDGWLPAMGMFWLFLGSILWIGLGWSANLVEDSRERGIGMPWGKALVFVGSLGVGIAWVYAFVHAGLSVPPTNPFHLFNAFYVFLALAALILAALLMRESSLPALRTTGIGAITALVVGVSAILFAAHFNIKPIRADILYKQGLQFDAQKQWEKAALFYEKALELAPTQDYYWLFAGRARLEHAKEQPPAARDAAFGLALAHLERAQSLSPYNTDHAANLARLYRTWAQHTEDPTLRQERFSLAAQYYAQALELTPQSAQLLDEWGLTYAMMGDTNAARAMYERSLALDDRFAYTYLLLGDLAQTNGNWPEMARYYEQVVTLEPDNVQGWSGLAYAYAQMEDFEQAIAANLRILEILPNDYVTLKNLAILCNNRGDYAQAQAYLERALSLAPQEDIVALQTLAKDIEKRLSPSQGE